MSLLTRNIKKFEQFEDSTTRYVLDERSLNSDQCYFVLQKKGGVKKFNTKELLAKFLETLAPNFVYTKLSEIAIHLIKNDQLYEVLMTQK